MERKYKMAKVYYIRVNGRCFQTTEKEERRDELLDILPRMYPTAEITCETKRERRYIGR